MSPVRYIHTAWLPFLFLRGQICFPHLFLHPHLFMPRFHVFPFPCYFISALWIIHFETVTMFGPFSELRYLTEIHLCTLRLLTPCKQLKRDTLPWNWKQHVWRKRNRRVVKICCRRAGAVNETELENACYEPWRRSGRSGMFAGLSLDGVHSTDSRLHSDWRTVEIAPRRFIPCGNAAERGWNPACHKPTCWSNSLMKNQLTPSVPTPLLGKKPTKPGKPLIAL